jgi:hypothetical protein
VNDDQQQKLEQIFDGEAIDDESHEPAATSEARAYLHQLGLLRDLARQHDPAAGLPSRAPELVLVRSTGRMLAAVLAIAASVVVLLGFGSRYLARTDRTTTPSITTAPPRPSSTIAVATAPETRAPQPTHEVEFYRWANAVSPSREDVARVVLSRVASPRALRASQEILALELANAPSDAIAKLSRSVAPRSATAPGALRKHALLRRHRPSATPKA